MSDQSNTVYERTFIESHSWFLDENGKPLFNLGGISLGLIAQIYIFERLISSFGNPTMSGFMANALKRKGYDWHAKFLTSLGTCSNTRVEDRYQFALLYDVRNFAITSSNNSIALELLKSGLNPIAILSDPKMKDVLPEGINSVCYTKFYNIGLESEIAIHWRNIKRELDSRYNTLVNRFTAFLGGDRNRALSIVKFLYPFFHQTIRDYFCILQLASNIGISTFILGSDCHKLSRMIALLGETQGWNSLVIQHGAPISPHAYVPVYGDRIAVWGELSKKWFMGRGVPAEKIIVTGNPRYDKIVGSPPTQPSTGSARKLIYLTNNFDETRKRLLLDMIVEAVKPLDISVVIKLHPSEEAAYYHDYVSRNATQITIANNAKLEELISPNDVVITVNSTAGIEALLLGATLHLIELPNIPNTIPYQDFNVATASDSADKLRENLSKILQMPSTGNEENKKAFLEAYLGPLDGKSAQRIVGLTQANLTDKSTTP